MSQLITVKCPSCGRTIEIDKVTGEIERHFEEGLIKKTKGDFFEKSLKELQYKKAARKEQFDRLKEEKSMRIKKIEDRFKLEREKVKKEPFVKPKNPFDLD